MPAQNVLVPLPQRAAATALHAFGQKALQRAGWTLGFQDELDRDRRKPDNDSAPPPEEAQRPRKKKGQSAEFGDALRSVYQRTINEDIPPEMLDLLGKLG